MPASTPPPHASTSAADAPTIWIAPAPPDGCAPAAARPPAPPTRSPIGTAFDVAARLGTAVTLAALLVVTATALGVVDDRPMPTGAATTGR